MIRAHRDAFDPFGRPGREGLEPEDRPERGRQIIAPNANRPLEGSADVVGNERRPVREVHVAAQREQEHPTAVEDLPSLAERGKDLALRA